MSMAARARDTAIAVAAAVFVVGCTATAPDPAPSTSDAPPTDVVTESPSQTPPPSPTLPPLTPGDARGALLVVQRAEDAALVAGEQPIRLTLARTGNSAAWFTSPPQKLSGTMTTEQALLSLGWRPSSDGTTSPLRTPRPNGLLSFDGGSLAFTAQRASVRADGTLVLDIRPIGASVQTVESYGPVTLTLDGAPGVLEFARRVGELTVRVVVTGERSQQAAVQVVAADGEILESGFVARDRPTVDTWLDVTSGTTVWSDPVVTYVAPERSKAGTIRISGIVTIDGVASPLDQVIARWSLPLVR